MEINLTRDAEKLAVAAYKVYLAEREKGASKDDAKDIEVQDIQPIYFSDTSLHDYFDTVAEMTRAFGCKMYIDGSFYLNDKFIAYMENRFKNGIKEALSFLAQFIP